MKKHIMMAVLLSLALTLTLGTGVFAAIAYLSNPGFETGDTTGWTETVPGGASINVVTSFTSDAGTVYNPPDGYYFAELKTDGPGEITKLTQSMDVSAGDTVSGWAFYDAQDYMPFNDTAEVVILDNTMAVVASLFYSDTAAVGDYGETPWTPWSHTFASAGIYYVEARVTNSLDSILDSYIGLDMEEHHIAVVAVGGEVVPVDKVTLLAPWIAFTVVIIIGSVFLICRRTYRQ